jgi:phage/plasmid-like protein (TIGR03299 family)
MAHEIESLDRPVYGNKTAAWHGLGKVIDGWMDAENVLSMSGQDYDVEKFPVFVQGPNGTFLPVPERFVTVRTDLDCNNPLRYLGAVGDKYTVIQNVSLVEFCKAMAADGDLKFETAGTLRNGKVAWMLACWPNALKIMDDTVRQYLMAATGHDGMFSFVTSATDVRVVCMNTLSAAVNDTKYQYRVVHTDNAGVRIDEARHALTHANAWQEKFGQKLFSFAQTAVDRRFVEAFLSSVRPGDEFHTTKTKGRTRTQVGNDREQLRDLIYGGQLGGDMDAVMTATGNPTVYGVYNALTQWGETDRSTRCHKQADGSIRSAADARMESVMFGGFKNLRQAAFNLLDTFTATGKLEGLEVAALEPATSN